MSSPKVSTHNRQSQVLIEPHPDCLACEQERINAERRLIANGALRLEVMDLRQLVKKHGGADALTRYDSDNREPVDRSLVPTCTHGRALSSRCRRCGRAEETEHDL